MSSNADMNKGTGLYVIEFLKSLPKSNDPEKDVLLSEAVANLTKYFELDKDAEQYKLRDGVTLKKLYQTQWEAAHPELVYAQPPPPPAAATVSATTASASNDDAAFEAYLTKLKAKGFFANLTEGTPAYEKRMEIARRTYSTTKHKSEPAAPEAKKECSCGDDVAEDPEFKNFLSILEKRGFFNGVTEGTPAYDKRMEIARSKYLLVANKKKATTTAAAAAAEPMEVEKDNDVSDDVNNEKMSEEERKAKAEEWKAKGNSEFSARNYSKAVEYYTEAIKMYPKNCIYFSNRAACHLSTGDNDSAIVDCEEAIRLDPRFVKSYIRLGTALMKKALYQDAIDRGFDKALEIDPTNTGALQGKAQAQKALLAAPPQQQEQQGEEEEQHSASSEPPRAARRPPPPSQAGGGMGGLDGLAGFMNNPEVMRVAQNMLSGGLMQQPGVSELLSNPAIQQMAMNMIQNPAVLSGLSGLFGGAGAGAGAGAPPSQQQQQQPEEEKNEDNN